MNLMALRPSQWDRLSKELKTDTVQTKFLEGVKTTLSTFIGNDVEDREQVYVLAVKSENIDAWAHVSIKRLAGILRGVDAETLKVFASGLTAAHRAELTSPPQAEESARFRKVTRSNRLKQRIRNKKNAATMETPSLKKAIGARAVESSTVPHPVLVDDHGGGQFRGLVSKPHNQYRLIPVGKRSEKTFHKMANAALKRSTSIIAYSEDEKQKTRD